MTTKNFFSSMHRFCETMIKYIALVPFILLTFLTAFFQSAIAFDITETSTITQNGPKFFLLLSVGVILIYAIVKLLDHVPEKAMFAVFTVLYLIMGIYLLTHINYDIRDDASKCYNNALDFYNGVYTNVVPGSYLYRNPHQLGLVVYESLLLHFNQSPVFLCVVNLIWVILTNLFLWLSSRLVYEDSPRIRKTVILFSFAFLPNFFYFFFAYGTIPGLGSLMIALYLTIRALKKHSKRSMFLSFVFIAFACIVKMNFVIAGVALILVYLVNFLKKQHALYLIAIFGIICSLLIPNRLLTGHYENLTDTTLTNGMPSTLYIAMGLQENINNWCAYGWYNHFNDNTYNHANYDAGLSSRVAAESIKERVSTFLSDPQYTFAFFSEKVITTWCEPTFQSIWSGPIISRGSSTEVPLLQNLYSGGNLFILFSCAMNVLVVCLFFFSALYVIWKLSRDKKPLNPLELFCLLYFIGGFLFHFVWETKSQYVYPYMLLLVPLAARGINLINLSDMINKLKNLKKPIKK